MPLGATDIQPQIIPAVTALIGATVGTLAVRTFARRFNIVNKPNPIVPQHTRPVAYLGGVGLAIGAASGMVALFLTGQGDKVLAVFPIASSVIPAFLFLALGVVDDLVTFKPAKKFVLQAGVAALAVGLGLWCPLTGIAIVDRALCWFWIVTLVNAFNFTDVCDGLLGSLSAVMFAFIAVAFPAVAPVAIVFAAASVGFLVFNKPPATIFLGDAGSHLLGFVAAALTLVGASDASTEPVSRLIAPLFLVSVPLFELTFLTVVRIRKGLAWWRGSPDHFSLRLQAGGFSRLQTDTIACMFAAAFGAAALMLPQASAAGRWAFVAAGVVVCLIAAKTLLRWEVKPKPKPQASVAPAAHVGSPTGAQHGSHVGSSPSQVTP